MWPPKLAVIAASVGTASALLVAPDSPCSRNCGNVLSSTSGSDLACRDSDYSSSAGIVFETCINCELTSTYAKDNQTDLQWLIYNLRYSVSFCLFGQPNNTNFQDNPCITSHACGPLYDAVYNDNLSTTDAAYDYCSHDWISDQVPKCSDCLRADGNMYFLDNFFTILDAACQQMPATGTSLGVQGNPFSTTAMTVTTPSATPTYTYTPSHSAVSLGGRVGIALGSLAFFLFIAGFTIVCLGRRRRRSYLRSIQSRYVQPGAGGAGSVAGSGSGWPTPNMGGSGGVFPSNDTPMSQKPLRSWEDSSPMTASTENHIYPRYFSPYNSQYNSPVSAVDARSQSQDAAWMSATAAAAAAAATATAGPSSSSSHFGLGIGTGSINSSIAASSALGQHPAAPEAPAYIGLALGGTDPSLRSKSSSQSMEASMAGPSEPRTVAATYYPAVSSPPSQQRTAAKSRGDEQGDEAYELREIDSNGYPSSDSRSASATHVPILHHPGYGRGKTPVYPSPAGASHHGLTEADARQGNAL